MCRPPSLPPSPPRPPIIPTFVAWPIPPPRAPPHPPPPPPPEAGKCLSDGISDDIAAFGGTLAAIALLMLALLLVLRRASPVEFLRIPKQTGWLTYFGALAIPVLLFLCTTGLYAACYLSPGLWTFCVLLFVFDTALFVYAAFGDAGSIAKASATLSAPKVAMVHGVEVTLKECKTCGIMRPPRASHDRKTDRCILRFDHYCPFTGNAVGLRNYLWFFSFIVCTTFSALIFIAICLWHVSHLSARILDDSKDGFAPVVSEGIAFGKALVNGGILSLALAAYFAMAALFTGTLVGFHCYFVSKGLTTYEWLKGTWKPGPNPFNRDLRQNWMAICHVAGVPPEVKVFSQEYSSASVEDGDATELQDNRALSTL